ncbi:MAG TPA: phospholipase [Rhodobacteraceae bacterium]|jgi:phospholipase/carboxylesterase|nr:phospholipase [Paracoccaceae bacterium]
MTRELNGMRQGAASGKATSMVIFLHGYGADGDDLMGLAKPLAPYMPDTVFVSPDGPEECAGNEAGRQWFSVPWIDNSSEEDAVAGMKVAVEDLNVYIDKIVKEEGVSIEKTVLFGFSQGTMMALQLAPRREEVFAAVVGFAGSLMLPDDLREEVISHPPVMLLHGEDDDVIPPEALNKAEFALNTLGFEVYPYIMQKTGHGIASDGLSVAAGFMREKLGIEGELQ